MIEIETHGHTTLLKMTHGKVNVLDIEFCQALNDQLSSLESNDCRAVVFTGNERAFSAGIDLKRWLTEGSNYVKPFLIELELVMERLFQFKKPIVAAISGHAIAGGCMLAAACDYRLIAPTVKIGIPEMRIGVPLPMMAIEIMRFVARPNSFLQIVNVGSLFTGPQAVEAGLANELAPLAEIRERAIEVANNFGCMPFRAFQMTKRQTREPVLRVVEQNKLQFFQEYLEIWQAAETRDAIQSYVDKRLS